jgi:hypothetical protein
MATAKATHQAGTCSSTIMTRLSVPTSSAVTMPITTWNSDRRNRRAIGSSGEAASANGMKRVP